MRKKIPRAWVYSVVIVALCQESPWLTVGGLCLIVAYVVGIIYAHDIDRWFEARRERRAERMRKEAHERRLRQIRAERRRMEAQDLRKYGIFITGRVE